MNLAKKGTVLLAALSAFAMTSCGPKEQVIDLAKAQEWLKNVDATKFDKTYIKTQKYEWKFDATGTGMLPKDGQFGFAQIAIAFYVDDKKVTEGGDPSEFLNKFKDAEGSFDYIKDSYKTQPIGEIGVWYCFDADDLKNAAEDKDCLNATFTLSNNILHFKWESQQDSPIEGKTIACKMDYSIDKNGIVTSIVINLDKQSFKGTTQLGGEVDGTLSGYIKQTMTYEER